MQFHLYKVSGYAEAIMALRMSQSKYYSWQTAQHIQDLEYVCTNKMGFLANVQEYNGNLTSLGFMFINFDGGLELHRNFSHPKITGNYQKDIAEFKRLLGLTMNNSMVEFDHHTLMKYIDISFFTDGLHRGAQDDLDAHAQRFNNRITRFSTRLAEIPEPKMSEWYEDKVIPFHDAIDFINGDPARESVNMPQAIEVGENIFVYTPFGYVLQKYEEMSEKNGLRKDVYRGLINLGHPGAALWKIDLHELRYVYFRRSKLTKANPELRNGMEQLADQIEASIPVFGKHFRQVFTDTGSWEHCNRTRTVTKEEYDLLIKLKEEYKKKTNK